MSIAHRPHLISTEAELRALIGEPTQLVQQKLSTSLNELTREFITASPFVLVGTAAPDGGLDVSPKGDPAGFVRILDDTTLLLPDRPGNRLADTLTNLLADPRIALLFLIPGIGEMFRVNGTARITDDQELLAASAIQAKTPKLGLLIDIKEAYTHCSKAAIRAELWSPERHRERSELPSNGAIISRLTEGAVDPAAYDAERAARYARREGLY